MPEVTEMPAAAQPIPSKTRPNLGAAVYRLTSLAVSCRTLLDEVQEFDVAQAEADGGFTFGAAIDCSREIEQLMRSLVPWADRAGWLDLPEHVQRDFTVPAVPDECGA